MGLKVSYKKSIFVFIFILCVPHIINSQEKSDYNIPKFAQSITSGDIDLDGDNDIIIRHKTTWQNTNPTISILSNHNHGGYFEQDTSISFCGSQNNIFLIDLNQDDFPDLPTLHVDFSSGEAERYLRVFFNEIGSLEDYVDFPLNHSQPIVGMCHGDVDNNGALDIVLASNQNQSWGVLYNDGFGNFTLPVFQTVFNTYPMEIDCSDLDGDGRDDILISGNKTLIYFSDSSGFILDSLPQISLGAEIIDFDNDGDNDIILFAPLGFINTYFYFYENISDREFELIYTDTLYNRIITEIQVVDFDNNGYSDMVCRTIGDFSVPDSISGIYIYYNQDGIFLSNPQFVQIDNYGESYRYIHCGDFDNNTYNDIAITRSYVLDSGHNLTLLFNDGNGNFVNSPQTGVSLPTGDRDLISSYPNPFNNQVSFKVDDLLSGEIQLYVYNLSGQLITKINQKMQSGGYTYMQWNGISSNSKKCPPGFYFATLLVNDQVIQTIKLLKTN